VPLFVTLLESTGVARSFVLEAVDFHPMPLEVVLGPVDRPIGNPVGDPLGLVDLHVPFVRHRCLLFRRNARSGVSTHPTCEWGEIFPRF
jgi:hypothetical protein